MTQLLRPLLVAPRHIALLGLLLVLGSPARAQQSNEALAKAAQNPVANLISVPFQDNINFNVGPQEKTQNVLNSRSSRSAWGPTGT
jgi:hypothetical protein